MTSRTRDHAPGFFPATYAEARSRFLALTSARDIPVQVHENAAHRGAEGERLFLDVAWSGDDDAETVLLIGAGTHGLEGHCGSGCITGGLVTGLFDATPPGVAVMLVHVFNPWGFSHCRRFNEDNVDLNRNFVDFDRERPANPDYDALHEHLVPDDWSGEGRRRADAAIAAYIEANGAGAYQAALTGGQYRHPDGVFYGGAKPTWSNRTWQDIVARRLAPRRRVLFIDVHTGLGPYGHGEPIFIDSSEPGGYRRMRGWLGDEVTDMHGGSSVSAPVQGPVSMALRWQAPDTDFWALSLEYGTRPIEQAIEALRAEHWLYKHPDQDPAVAAAVRSRFLDAFYVDEDEWKVRVWARFQDVYRSAVEGLAATA